MALFKNIESKSIRPLLASRVCSPDIWIKSPSGPVAVEFKASRNKSGRKVYAFLKQAVRHQESELVQLKEIQSGLKEKTSIWEQASIWEKVFANFFEASEQEKERRLSNIDNQIEMFSQCGKSDITRLTDQLIVLREEYRLTAGSKVLYYISRLIVKIKQLLQNFIKKAKKSLVYLFRFFIFQYTVNKRDRHRKVVRFLFKNLSDTSGADSYISSSIYRISEMFQLSKLRYNEFKEG